MPTALNYMTPQEFLATYEAIQFPQEPRPHNGADPITSSKIFALRAHE